MVADMAFVAKLFKKLGFMGEYAEKDGAIAKMDKRFEHSRDGTGALYSLKGTFALPQGLITIPIELKEPLCLYTRNFLHSWPCSCCSLP